MFRQSGSEPFDAVILATGFRPDLRTLLPEAKGVLSGSGAPLVSGPATAEAGLFFCGAIVSANRTVATDRHRSGFDRGCRRSSRHGARWIESRV